MREYGQIQCAFWINPDVKRLADSPKLLAAYLLSGPHSNGLGCYQLPDGYVQADLGWSSETVSKGFQTLSEKGFAMRCEASGYVFIPKYLKWNPISNKNVATARQREYETVPSSFAYFQELASDLLAFGKHLDGDFVKRLETVSKGFRNGYRTVVGNPFETRPDPTRPDPSGSKEGLAGIDLETGEVVG